MTRTVVLALAVSGLVTLYGAERYAALTKEEVAYVYHPETDNVYAVVLGAAPDRLFKKQLLLPFHAPSREIKIAEEQGSMRSLLREKAARDTLFSWRQPQVQRESVVAQWTRWAGPSLDSVRLFGYRWDFPDLAWVPRRDLKSPDLLPLELLVILPVESATWFWDDVFPIDAVVVKERFQASAVAGQARPNTFDVLTKAVLIRGEAAEYLAEVLAAG